MRTKNLLLFLFFVAMPSFCRATDRYVSTTGSDTTGNGTQAAPFATALKAYNVASVGDRIIFRAGTYPTILRVWKPNLEITSYPGELATLQFPSSNTSAHGDILLWLLAPGANIHDIDFDGFYHGETYYCVYCIKAEGAYSPTAKITNCHIRNSADALVKCAAPTNAATSTNPGMGITISGCTLSKDSTVPQLRGSWTAIDSLMNGTVVDGCTFFGIKTSAISFKGGVTGCVAENNVIDGCPVGIWLGAYDGGYVFNPNGTNPTYQSCIGAVCKGNVLTNCNTYGIVLMGAGSPIVTGNTLNNCGATSACLWIMENSYYSTTMHPTWGHCSNITVQGNTFEEGTGTYRQGSYTWQGDIVKINDTMLDLGSWGGNTYKAVAGYPWFADIGTVPVIFGYQSPGSSNPPTTTNFPIWSARYTTDKTSVVLAAVPVGGTP